MRWLIRLQHRYAWWLYQHVQRRLVAEGYWDTDPEILLHLIEGVHLKLTQPVAEPSMELRLSCEYATTTTNIDNLLVRLNQAIQTMQEATYVEVPPPETTLTTTRLDRYLTDNYGRPLPFQLALTHSLKIIEQFVRVWKTVTDVRRRAYYLRKYYLLFEESQQWLEFVQQKLF